MKNKNTFKVIIESEKNDSLGEAKFRMRKTYHLPINELPQVIAYLEQFKTLENKKPISSNER